MSNRNPATLQLDHTHCRAICDEIGERLREVLGREIPEIPPHLLALLDRLAQLDDAPSIAPSIGKITSFAIPRALRVSRYRESFARAMRTTDLAMAATNRGSASDGS